MERALKSREVSKPTPERTARTLAVDEAGHAQGTVAGLPIFLRGAATPLIASDVQQVVAPRVTTEETTTPADGSRPLDTGMRLGLEAAFRQDLTDVRVHAGPRAGLLASRHGARAFALGRELFFGAHEYAPATAAGRHLLVHEVAHAVQGGTGGATARVASPAEEADAAAAADAVELGRAPRLHDSAGPPLLGLQPIGPTTGGANASIELGASLESDDRAVRTSALARLAHRVDEDAWRALLLAQDSRHEDVRTEVERIVRSRLAAERHFADYVRALAASPRGALSDLAIRALARTGAGGSVPLETYRSVIHQRLALARRYLGELDDALYDLVSAAIRGPVARVPAPTTEIDQLEVNVDALPAEDLWEVGLQASTLLDQIAPVRQSVAALRAAYVQADDEGSIRRVIHSQLLLLLVEARKLTGAPDDPAFVHIQQALGSFPAKFAKVIVDELHKHFTAARAELRKTYTQERVSGEGAVLRQNWPQFLKATVVPVDEDLTLMIQELEMLGPMTADDPDAVFARLDGLQSILRSIGERAQYLQHAGAMLDLYLGLKATSAEWRSDRGHWMISTAWDFFVRFQTIAVNRDTKPEWASQEYARLVQDRDYDRLMEDVEIWQEILDFEATVTPWLEAILIILLSIETGGLAGGLVRGLFGRAVTLPGRIAVGTLAFAGEVTAFTATSRGLRWALHGSAGPRSFGGELAENALMFGWLKATGAVYQRFVRGAESMSATAKAIGGATTTFVAFQAWAVGLERFETGQWLTPLHRRFWEVAAENAVFLAAIHLGRPLVHPLFAPAKSAVMQFSVARHNARCRELGARMDAWESMHVPDWEGAVGIMRRTHSLYLERLEVLREINRSQPTDLTGTELGEAEAVLRRQLEATENALFQARFRMVAHESLPDAFYYDGDPVALRGQYERQGYEFIAQDSATGHLQLKAPDGRVVDLIRTQLAPTGAGRGPASAAAEAQYALIRKLADDVTAISRSTDIPEFVLRQVKSHLFVATHEVPLGPGNVVRMNFRADPHMARLWLAAAEGTLSDADLVAFRRRLVHEFVESQLMKKGLAFRSAHQAAWRSDVPGEHTSWPTAERFGAHDLAPLADADLPPFAHWRPMLGIEPTAAEANRRGVRVEPWMGIEFEPEPGPSADPTGGVLVELTPKQDVRLGRLGDVLRRGGKWTDLTARDRFRLGRVFDKILQPLARMIARGGWAKDVLHYVEINAALIAGLRQGGGRVLITEGRLPSGRVDYLMLDFDANKAEILDVTSLDYERHTDKTAGYKKDIGRITGMPVDAIEARYVGTDGELLQTLLEVAQ